LIFELDRGNWKRVALGDVAAASKEKVDPTSGQIERYVAGEHMDTDNLKLSRWGQIGDGYLGPAFHRRFHRGQVLYGSRRTYLRKVAVAEFEGVTANTTFVVETKDRSVLLQEFLPFVMISEPFHAFAIHESKGSVNPYVNWSDIERYEFDLPPLDEQRRLADLLWSFERHRVALVAEHEMIAVARQTWISREVDRLLDTTVVPFEQLWSRSPESGWSAPPVDEATGAYVLSLSALGPDGYRPGHLKKVHDCAELRSVRLTAGDLLISRANTADAVGRVGIYSEARDDVSFPDTMMRLHVSEDVRPEFAEAVLASPHGRRYMRKAAAGSATSMVKINRQSLGKFPFPRASSVQQREVLAQLVPFTDAIASSDRALWSLDASKSAVLAQALGGAHDVH